MKKGTVIKSSNGKESGIATGSNCKCSMHGCTGIRIYVKWPDGKLTKPCSKGLKSLSETEYQIM